MLWHTAEVETPTGDASALAEPDLPASQLNDIPMEGTPDALAAQLAHLIESVGTIEELSRQAREAAVGDLARYEALVASSDQYRCGLEQAGAIRDQAHQALDHAFGRAARSAAAALADEAERVLAAFTQLVTAWQERAATFLADHPDVELLVAERRAQEEEARRQEAIAARMRRRAALLADVDAALEQQVLPEARRALALFEREFPDEVDAIGLCRKRLQQTLRAEQDLAARQALLLAAEHQLRGDLEAASATLEQVDVDGLSVDVSEDVFGRWCDTCSRLAQTTGAWLVRDAPTQGRGLVWVGVLGSAAARVDIRTFHSFGLRVIRTWSEELGFGHVPPAVYGRDDTHALLRRPAAELGLVLAPEHPTGEADPWALSASQLARALERFRLCGADAAAGVLEAAGIDEALLHQLADIYEQLLRRDGAVDYASMLLLPLRLFETELRALHTLQDAYRQVLVDEVQGTCRVQYGLLQQLVARHRNLALVGDPLQSVYSFRGADPTLLQAFPTDFPEARVFVLDENHRSTATIVRLANAVAAPLAGRPASWTTNPAGPAARLYRAEEEADEARFVAEEVARLLRTGEITRPGQVAVLFRTNAQARILAGALRAHGIPV